MKIPIFISKSNLSRVPHFLLFIKSGADQILSPGTYIVLSTAYKKHFTMITKTFCQMRAILKWEKMVPLLNENWKIHSRFPTKIAFKNSIFGCLLWRLTLIFPCVQYLSLKFFPVTNYSFAFQLAYLWYFLGPLYLILQSFIIKKIKIESFQVGLSPQHCRLYEHCL